MFAVHARLKAGEALSGVFSSFVQSRRAAGEAHVAHFPFFSALHTGLVLHTAFVFLSWVTFDACVLGAPVESRQVICPL